MNTNKHNGTHHLENDNDKIAAYRASLLRQNLLNFEKRRILGNMKVFVLDNSLRESTVGQCRPQSLQDKFRVLEQAKKCGFHHNIVACFSDDRTVDDEFCEALRGNYNMPEHQFFYSFSEVADTYKDGMIPYGEFCIPLGLRKCQQYNIPNVILEVDIAEKSLDWDGTFSVAKIVLALSFLLMWAKENIQKPGGPEPINFINFRDLPTAMTECPKRLLDLVAEIARLPPAIRPAGILYEDAIGGYFAEELGSWTAKVRETMTENNWESKFQECGDLDGLLLVHIHKQWGLADACVLDCLAAGCDGIWCSVAEEGTVFGHACSSVTIANLVRLGNKDVLKRYNIHVLPYAAGEVTHIITKKPVHERQIVYGSRAVKPLVSAMAKGNRDNEGGFHCTK